MIATNITQTRMLRKYRYLIILFISFLGISNGLAADRIVHLVVANKEVNFSGEIRKAIAVNDQIPAPTLHFKQGDHLTINVHNHMDKATAIHWHGIIIPWQMDGVEGITQQPIPPGGTFHYQFTLNQAGTYWYHAHAGVQEQEGLYGAFIIDPPRSTSFKYTKDYVVILSDWSNTAANKILANLKKDGDYFSPRFPLQPSLSKFIHDYRKALPEERKKLVEDYKMMQQMRMSIYDLSDVAYDAYLLNGQTKSHPWTASVKKGDVVRLRFIGAAGSTIYRVKIPDAKVKMVHIQGNDIKPYNIKDFSIAPGETYDVLVRIDKNVPYIIYAESLDTLGAAYGALVTDPQQAINYNQVTPFPEPLPVTREMMHNMMAMSSPDHEMKSMPKTTPSTKPLRHNMNMPGMHHGDMNMKSMPGSTTPTKPKKHNTDMPGLEHGAMNIKSVSKPTTPSTPMKHNMDMPSMDHGSMTMPTEPTIISDTLAPADFVAATTSGTKYQNLIAAVKTNDPNIPVTSIIKMELFGYMDHFIWFINGVPEYNAKPIQIAPGKRYRIIFTNQSMMRHPMHLHGHWFILRNGHGAYDPLLHTLEVPPGATAVADFESDASGQWFFHCHHLFHMMTGMSRVFQYETIINIANGTAKPENKILQQPYINRPIVRVDNQVPIDSSLIHHPMAHPHGLYLANFLTLGEDPFHNVQEITYKGLFGRDYNKLELLSEDAEIKNGEIESADLDIFYWHLLTQFWAVKGGVNYYYRPAGSPYWQPGIGIEGLMPYFIDTNIRTYYHAGSVKLDAEFSRDTQITNNFFIRAGIRSILATKTVTVDEIGRGLNQIRYSIRPFYRLMPGINVFAEYEYDKDYSALKSIHRSKGEPTNENTLTFGVSVLF